MLFRSQPSRYNWMLQFYLRAHGLALSWVGTGRLIFRVLQLWITKNLIEGLAWGTKIVTDPFHDILLYHKAPLLLMRGQTRADIASH